MRRLLAMTLMLLLLGAATASAEPLELAVERVDTSRYPQVSVTVLLPPEMSAAGQGTLVSVEQNGEPLEGVTMKDAASSELPLAVVLVIDTSGSMSGAAFGDEKKAAHRFIDSMKDGDRVAIVSFSEKRRIVSDFSFSDAKLHKAVDSLKPGGETALYDAVATAGKLTSRVKGASCSAVVLSDGGDTVSTSSLADALDEVLKARIPVYTVGLVSNEQDHQSLRMLAKHSGGRFFKVDKSSSLPALYESLATEMRSRYQISFEAEGTSASQLDFVMSLERSGNVGRTVFSMENLDPVSTAPRSGSAPRMLNIPARFFTLDLVLVVALVFVSASLALYAVLSAFKRQDAVMDQLKYYEQLREHDPNAADRDGVTEAMMTVVGQMAERRGLTSMIQGMLLRAAVPMRAEEWIFFHVITVVLAGLAVHVLWSSALLTIAVVVAGATLPVGMLGVMASRRLAKFDSQIPDVLSMISGSLRSGYGLQQAIDLVSREMADPSALEFRRVLTETRLGLPLEEALGRMAERMNSVDFRWTVIAMNIQRDVGGNLAEVLDNVAETVRERAALNRHVHALTSEGRVSAYILLGLPLLMLAGLSVTSKMYVQVLFQDRIGIGLLVMIGFMMLLGAVILRRIVKIEV